MRTIGILASQPLPPIQRFVRKLRDYGYVEGQNLRLVSRFAEGRDDRYPVMAGELAALPVDLILTWGTPAALAAKQATKTIPVLMGAIADPVSVGMTHPDGVLVAPDLLLLTRRREIATALAKSKLPAVYPFREYTDVDGLIIHGANLGILFERAADYVDRIL